MQATPSIAPPSVQLEEGSTLNLTCEATPSFPPPRFSWFRDSVLLTDSNQQLDITTPTQFPLTSAGLYLGVSRLVVPVAFPSHSGNYTCRAEQSVALLNMPITAISKLASVQINGL